MKLGRRALLAETPVVLAGFVLAQRHFYRTKIAKAAIGRLRTGTDDADQAAIAGAMPAAVSSSHTSRHRWYITPNITANITRNRAM